MNESSPHGASRRRNVRSGPRGRDCVRDDGNRIRTGGGVLLATYDKRERPAVIWRSDYLRGPFHDLAMATLWLPFVLAAVAVRNDPENLRWLVSATLLFSFAHQPLTLWLLYADAGQRRAHARLAMTAPFVLFAAVVVGTSTHPGLVALVAGAWNVAHTLRQRYGLCKLYGRLSGVDCGADNRLLWSWLVSAVLIALVRTDLGRTARDVGLGRRNLGLIDGLASVQAALTIAVPFALLATVVISATWLRDEIRRSTHSTTRLAYLASTAALLAVLAVDPVVGFVGYVGAHAAEYFFVVRWRLDGAAERPTAGNHVGRLAGRVGGVGTLGLYALAIIAFVVTLRVVEPGAVLTAVVLTLGGLHLLFDGVIWRSPRTAPVRSKG